MTIELVKTTNFAELSFENSHVASNFGYLYG